MKYNLDELGFESFLPDSIANALKENSPEVNETNSTKIGDKATAPSYVSYAGVYDSRKTDK